MCVRIMFGVMVLLRDLPPLMMDANFKPQSSYPRCRRFCHLNHFLYPVYCICICAQYVRWKLTYAAVLRFSFSIRGFDVFVFVSMYAVVMAHCFLFLTAFHMCVRLDTHNLPIELFKSKPTPLLQQIENTHLFILILVSVCVHVCVTALTADIPLFYYSLFSNNFREVYNTMNIETF